MKIRLYIIIIVGLFFLNLKYIPLSLKIYTDLALIVYLFLDFCFCKKDKARDKYTMIISALMILPFVSAIPCYIYRDQAILDTLFVTRGQLLWLFFFYLRNHKVNVKTICEVFAGIGLFTAVINIIQQFTYPNFALFGVTLLNGADELDIRNGFYRFLFTSTHFMLFSFFYYLYTILDSKTGKLKNILFTIISFIGIYYTMTRQLWLACIGAFVLYYFLVAKMSLSRKILLVLLTVSALLFISNNLGTIIGTDVLEETDKNLNNENYVRWVAYDYFGLEYWESPFNVLFGNGQHREGVGSPYANHIAFLYEELGLYRSDIGIVGKFSLYGFIYCVVIILFYITILVHNKRYPPYIIMLLLASIITIPMSCWFDNMLLMSGVIFICSRHEKTISISDESINKSVC